MSTTHSPLPVFVAGPGRAGTTVLTMVLSAHPAVCLAPENRFVPALLEQSQGRGMLQGAALTRFQDNVVRDAKLAALKINTAPYLARVEGYETVSVRDAILDFLLFYRDQVDPGAHCVGQKKNFLENGPALKRALPEAKLVTIFRDCRATAASAARSLEHQPLAVAAEHWVRRARLADAFRAAHPNDYFEIRYESFVQEPEATCRALCGFLGIPFEPRMLRHHEDNAGYARILRGHEAKHAHTANPVHAARLDSWRDELSPRNIRLIESIAGPEMVGRGYVLAGNTDDSRLEHTILMARRLHDRSAAALSRLQTRIRRW